MMKFNKHIFIAKTKVKLLPRFENGKLIRQME
ncbi:hypothetical protein ELUMI_v1c08370 [Williamsoniiplasma luminosum]|uniref:Uncharacterized protein n=1 Tax=Williamsoniiplasma luminosum TaxID=214888 RepID=A0A2K8NWI4_9MOLU|nr:hypothetical protein ELUMI_v1c08370 [Williamsoniiplasma luminosum]